ncbi:MAG: response regulator [Candidatus Methylacidiphilales bacterium]|nr:response regulator [Candidatus Methylacidiphilales bacterium]
MIQNKYAVLLADDSSDDRLFMRKALSRSTRLSMAAEVCDGQEAIEYLKGNPPFSNRDLHPWPDLLILDLKMPRKNGFDVLQWLKHQAEAGTLARPTLTVVIVSGAFLERDISQSLEMGAAGYFKKTSVRREQEDMVQELEKLMAEKAERKLSPES